MKFKVWGGEEGRSKAEIFLYTEQRNPEREGRRNPINQKKWQKRRFLCAQLIGGGIVGKLTSLLSRIHRQSPSGEGGVSLFFKQSAKQFHKAEYLRVLMRNGSGVATRGPVTKLQPPPAPFPQRSFRLSNPLPRRDPEIRGAGRETNSKECSASRGY